MCYSDVVTLLTLGCGRELILVIKKFVAPVYIYGEELPARLAVGHFATFVVKF